MYLLNNVGKYIHINSPVLEPENFTDQIIFIGMVVYVVGGMHAPMAGRRILDILMLMVISLNQTGIMIAKKNNNCHGRDNEIPQ